MFFRKDSSHSEPERISSVPDSIVNTINIGTQNINVNMLLAEQTRYTQNFDKIYAKLNKTGWKYLRDVEANINNPSQYERLRNQGLQQRYVEARNVCGRNRCYCRFYSICLNHVDDRIGK